MLSTEESVTRDEMYTKMICIVVNSFVHLLFSVIPYSIREILSSIICVCVTRMEQDLGNWKFFNLNSSTFVEFLEVLNKNYVFYRQIVDMHWALLLQVIFNHRLQ